MIVVPHDLAAFGKGLHARGIAEALMRGDRAVDDAPEVRADLVRSALLDGVTACAFLEHGLAGGGIGAGEQRPDRFGLRFLAAGSTRFACRFLGDDGETFLLGSFGMENAFRRNGYGHQNEDRTQQGTHTHVHIWIHLQTLP